MSFPPMLFVFVSIIKLSGFRIKVLEPKYIFEHPSESMKLFNVTFILDIQPEASEKNEFGYKKTLQTTPFANFGLWGYQLQYIYQVAL